LSATREDTKKVDPILLKGRNPRQIQFYCNKNDKRELYSAFAHNRIRVKRSKFEYLLPSIDYVLNKESASLIPHWIGRKYFRPAFPDEFNSRMKSGGKTAKSISKLLKKISGKVEDLYIKIEPMQEISSEKGSKGNYIEEYDVIILATIPTEFYDDPKVRIDIQDKINNLGAKLCSCNGIQVIDSNADSEENITLADISPMSLWDFDYLSVSDEISE